MFAHSLAQLERKVAECSEMRLQLDETLAELELFKRERENIKQLEPMRKRVGYLESHAAALRQAVRSRDERAIRATLQLEYYDSRLLRRDVQLERAQTQLARTEVKLGRVSAQLKIREDEFSRVGAALKVRQLLRPTPAPRARLPAPIS